MVQRVSSASVEVDGQSVGSCGKGLLILVAVHREDTFEDATRLADKVMGLRIFNDQDGKLNLNVSQALGDAKPALLVVSNFTLYGDAVKSRRPSFGLSAPFDVGSERFEQFVCELRKLGAEAQTGVFGADMRLHSVNDGPVTLILDTR